MQAIKNASFKGLKTLPLGTARKQQESVARRRIHRTAQASDDNLVVGNAAEAPTQTNALSAVIGGAGLVTGSTVGAGILALPAVTHSTGFGPTSSLLLGCWLVLQLEALLIVVCSPSHFTWSAFNCVSKGNRTDLSFLQEVNLWCHNRVKNQQPDDTEVPPLLLADMARITLGSIPEALTSSVYLTMSFTLLLAYIAKAGDIFDSAVIQSTSVEACIGPLLFTVPLATTFIKGGTGALEKTNRNLTGAMLVLFAAVVGWGFDNVPWELSPLSHADTSDVAPILPIMFLSLVYHDLIPVVCHYLGFKRGRILLAVLLGSVVPLGMFLAFEAVCLGLVPYTPGVSVDPLEVLISSQGPIAGTAVAVFSLAALATSAIGTTLSLTSFITTKLESLTSINQLSIKLPQLPDVSPDSLMSKVTQPPVAKSAESESLPAPTPAHVCAVLLTLTPPTVASISGTDIFMTATHLAGAYGMTALYGLLPPVLAWSVRRNADAEGTQGNQLLPGGEPILAGLFAAGVGVFSLQLQADVSAAGAAADAAGPGGEFGQLSMGVATELLTTVSSVSDGLVHSASLLL